MKTEQQTQNTKEMDKKTWDDAQKTLSKTIGVPIYLTDTEGNRTITNGQFPFFCEIVEKKGRILCQECRKQWMQLPQTTITTCHAGLTNIVSPIHLDGKTVGVIVASSIKNENANNHTTAKKLGMEYQDLQEEYAPLPKLDKEQLKIAAAMLHATANILPEASANVAEAHKAIASNHTFLSFASHVHAEPDLTSAVTFALDKIVKEFSLIDCTIMLDTKTFRYNREDAEKYVPLERIIWAHVTGNRTIVTIKNISTDFLTSKVEGTKEMKHGVIAIPLLVNEQLIGVTLCYGANTDIIDRLLPFIDATCTATANHLRLHSMRETAITDHLTSLYNKRYFLEALNNEVNRSSRFGRPTSLMIFDVDNFKQYNDTYGHPDGDVLLKTMGKLLKNNVGGFDTPCRYGGEEFVVIMPETKPDHAFLMAEKIRQAVEQADFPNRKVTVSIGLVTCTNSTARAEQLIQEADKALYKSKRNGKNKTTHVIIIDKNLAPIDVEEANAIVQKINGAQQN